MNNNDSIHLILKKPEDNFIKAKAILIKILIPFKMQRFQTANALYLII